MEPNSADVLKSLNLQSEAGGILASNRSQPVELAGSDTKTFHVLADMFI